MGKESSKGGDAVKGKSSSRGSKKLFFRMGEVCEMTGLEPHVLRFWETEFPMLKPGKNRSGHRVFSRQDVDLVQRIKKLLHEEGFTIAGAVKQLEESEKPSAGKGSGMDVHKVREELKGLRASIQNVLNLLDPNP